MPYIATFEALKKRAKRIDPAASSAIDRTDVRNVALLVDRYPLIVPPKYASCRVEAFVDDVRQWVVEFDAQRPREALAAQPERAPALKALDCESMGAGLGILGSFLLALGPPFGRWGWLCFLGSNLAWLAFARDHGHRKLQCQTWAFLVSTLLGLFNSLVGGSP